MSTVRFYVRHVDVHMHVTSAEPKRTVDPDEHDGLEDADDEQRDGADDLVDECENVDASLHYHREGAEEGEDEDDQAEDDVTEAAFAEERNGNRYKRRGTRNSSHLHKN